MKPRPPRSITSPVPSSFGEDLALEARALEMSTSPVIAATRTSRRRHTNRRGDVRHVGLTPSEADPSLRTTLTQTSVSPSAGELDLAACVFERDRARDRGLVGAGRAQGDDERGRVRRRLVGEHEAVAVAAGADARRCDRARRGRARGGDAAPVSAAGVEPVRPAAGAVRAHRVHRRARRLGVAPAAWPQHPRRGVLDDLERGGDLRALAVGAVPPHARPVRAGAEVVRVRAARHVDQRGVAGLLDVAPGLALGVRVLAVDDPVGLLGRVELRAGRAPVALVLAAAQQRAEQLEVVVVVEEPVLEPEAALRHRAGRGRRCGWRSGAWRCIAAACLA